MLGLSKCYCSSRKYPYPPHGGHFSFRPSTPRNFHSRGFLSHPLPHPLVRLGTLSKEYYFVAKMLLHDIFKSHTQDTFNFELRCPPWEGRGGGYGYFLELYIIEKSLEHYLHCIFGITFTQQIPSL